MDPLVYPNIIKHGRQLDFHEFSNKVAPFTFGYPPVISGLREQIKRSFHLLQGDNLTPLAESMMSNLMLVFRQDHLDERPWKDGGWKTAHMYEFCNSLMFEATFLTMYGRPASASRHSGMELLRKDFVLFDSMFPLLIAQIPIWLLGRTKTIRDKLIHYFLPQRTSCWSNASQFIKMRSDLFEQHDTLRDVDKAGRRMITLLRRCLHQDGSGIVCWRGDVGEVRYLVFDSSPSSSSAHHFAILWASVGNTIPATFWAMYHLVSHPPALRVVRQEILDVLKMSDDDLRSDTDMTLSREQLEKLHHLGTPPPVIDPPCF